MPDISFGVSVVPRGPDHGRDLLLRMEDTEFDTAWVGDSLGDWNDPSAPLLDSWITLGAMAVETEDLELGMLVTDLSWRDPVQVARFAMSVDQLTNGRFVLGLGCGQRDDQVAAGGAVLHMESDERSDRLEEGVRVIDQLLRGNTGPFEGTFTRYTSAATAPASVQSPRLPLLVSGNAQRTIRIAVDHADTWNTWVDSSDIESVYQQTAERVHYVQECLAQQGRDSDTLTRSLSAFSDAFDPWSTDDAIPRLVEQFAPLGFTEFVFSPPRPDQMRDFLRIGVDVLATFRD